MFLTLSTKGAVFQIHHYLLLQRFHRIVFPIGLGFVLLIPLFTDKFLTQLTA